MDKSKLTTAISAGLIGVGYLCPPVIRTQVISIGLYATSGAVTNWLAVHMLFEKVPGLYGSGVIPARFEAFKGAIRNMIMEQFFTPENVVRIMEEELGGPSPVIKTDEVVENIDYDQIFQALVDVVLESKYGGMLKAFGGQRSLENLREPFEEKTRRIVKGILESEAFHEALESSLESEDVTQDIIEKIEKIVSQRLEELTPEMVKEIIQKMIREHLGWLVVWGGVFGGVIGLVCSFLDV